MMGLLSISLIILVVRTAIPGYELKKGKSLQFIEYSDHVSLDTINYNMKYIDLSIFNTLKLYESNKSEELRDVVEEIQQIQIQQDSETH